VIKDRWLIGFVFSTGTANEELDYASDASYLAEWNACLATNNF
jgi:hypothetical protein